MLLLIFPLSFTLTLFLMWIIISLNGTILHLAQRKQRFKLQMFQRLWRILVVSVIAVLAFFVVSTMSLSNRLDEDYAPKNWKYRWILLDASLAGIYLLAFAAIAWLWRPVSWTSLVSRPQPPGAESFLLFRLGGKLIASPLRHETMSVSPCRKSSHKMKARPMRKTTRLIRSSGALTSVWVPQRMTTTMEMDMLLVSGSTTGAQEEQGSDRV